MFSARHRLDLPSLPDLDKPQLQADLQTKIDQKTKPPGSLGQLEELAMQLGRIQGSLSPSIEAPQIRVFAADHGLAAEGVSAFPQEVTRQMVNNFLAGGAAINVFARQQGVALKVVDAGVDADFEPHPDLLSLKVMRGTRNCLKTAAMNAEECLQALVCGMALVREAPGNLLIVGEMGIGNTSAASLLLSKLTDLPLEACIGPGTGLDSQGLEHKKACLQKVLHKHHKITGTLEILATLGGVEIAMMTGALLQAASERRILLMDGFIASVALLVAERLQPGIRHFAIFSHQSAEPGHRHLLELLEARPLLDLGLRLGEGTGALLALPLLQAATAFLNEMASFESAGVSQ
ncbi:nicotinate-nucleotide--dimethylbenzimidazole phosphoribosyltransferase [Marinospirillum perlucidum]|uniref:nicotinate-nucleotide--dimethylbenzimidazole phosphoribosyltransferase n=1 Tax=Marinospirillum perlucidum TaxID=1982602 RepID=UPI000DF3A984|nr:nicotinate-nucleotide--dimethylbenzimidazole phosphoribosyltransferase [Marinospirillum perlucidum]